MQQTITKRPPSEAVVVQVQPGSGLLGPGASQLTRQDVQAMRIRLRDLRNELQDAAERRNNIASRLRDADPAARPGYEGRLQALDARIIGIENEITRVVQQMGTAPPEALVAVSSQPANPEAIAAQVVDRIVPIVAILSIFVFMPLTFAFSRFIWRRAVAPARPAAIDHTTQQRLESLQQSVDTIAIEVERISESQRFVTRILNERVVGAGAAEPVRAANKSALHSER
jgi:hypothetical protein